ncbi:MAG: malonyl-CoA synthase [Gammaproteobacteria bacterium]|nr:malonyl-CoA synthase [Gammaproteobacteria bacterium]NIR85005.1 malonyl-CoA synthase [Gammaproteobacteria bacterium]NIR88272.1 malonyl-CoA synthase [Gammaproteobacteria bacterium]NIU06052.1 malonyl-CoA synthase [Gammaproteobacteria bacterium]NIV73471.1 AMP-binding protein [Gammaproteobacteria bacterium]
MIAFSGGPRALLYNRPPRSVPSSAPSVTPVSECSHNLYRTLHAAFAAHLAAPCLETPEGGAYTYRDVEVATARLANVLRGTGLREGDRVAAQVDKSPQALFLYLACLRAGLVYLPLNVAYKSAELDFFLGDAEPGLVVARPQAVATLEGLCRTHGVRALETLDAVGGGSLMDKAAGASDLFDPVAHAPDDLAALLYTSGTTGRPKGAMLTHRNLEANARALHEFWGWRPDDVLLHALPLFHVHGLFVACHCALLGASRMIFLPRFETEAVIEHLPRATVMMGVPTFYTRLLAEPRFGADVCRRMRVFISGSAPLQEQTFHAFRARTGHTILERYGMSETGMNTSNPLQGERRAGTVGVPLPGVSVRVVDERGHALPPGQVGGIEVRGENVFPGYWRLPEKTREEFTADGYFRTGDLGCFDAEGYLAIVGRARDLVITGGYNVYPKEIERHIDAVPGVKESAVIGLPHPDYGEAVTAVVVPDDCGQPPQEAVIIARLKESLAGYKVPKRVFFVDALPRNAMGKIQKNALRERYGDDSGAPLT